MKLLQDTKSLIVLFILTLAGMRFLHGGKYNFFKDVERASLAPFLPIILLIIEHTVLFSDLTSRPSIIGKIVKSDRFAFAVSIISVFLATKDIEITVLVVLSYLLFLQIIRTRDETNKNSIFGHQRYVGRGIKNNCFRINEGDIIVRSINLIDHQP